MKVVVTRVKNANVKVDNKLISEIKNGLLVLVGFTQNDKESEIEYMVKKITNLRIFDDENGIMNKSIQDIKGEILSVSQFTLYGDASKGNRPSYIKALKGEEAIKLYDLFNKKLNEIINTKTGIFGAEMQVESINDGPVTIIIEK
jgi:D-tyrosyl-tRNA(Tyr) deacylase